MKTRAKSVKTYKIILLGDCQVGKTCIIERFVSQRFSPEEQVRLSTCSPPSASTSSPKPSPSSATTTNSNSGTLPARKST